jgi:hypothetical protein
MPRTFKENLTNWLVAVIGFAGALWINTVINNQAKILDKLDTLSVMMATANSERGAIKINVDKIQERLDKMQGISANQKLFKHEDLFTLN